MYICSKVQFVFIDVYWELMYVSVYPSLGQDDYDRLRPLSYQNANLVLVCYDVTNPTSFENVLIKVPSSNDNPKSTHTPTASLIRNMRTILIYTEKT